MNMYLCSADGDDYKLKSSSDREPLAWKVLSRDIACWSSHPKKTSLEPHWNDQCKTIDFYFLGSDLLLSGIKEQEKKIVCPSRTSSH